MAYFYNDDNDSRCIGGKPTEQEIDMGENRDSVDEWDPETEDWDEFQKRTSQ